MSMDGTPCSAWQSRFRFSVILIHPTSKIKIFLTFETLFCTVYFRCGNFSAKDIPPRLCPLSADNGMEPTFVSITLGKSSPSSANFSTPTSYALSYTVTLHWHAKRSGIIHKVKQERHNM